MSCSLHIVVEKQMHSQRIGEAAIFPGSGLGMKSTGSNWIAANCIQTISTISQAVYRRRNSSRVQPAEMSVNQILWSRLSVNPPTPFHLHTIKIIQDQFIWRLRDQLIHLIKSIY